MRGRVELVGGAVGWVDGEALGEVARFDADVGEVVGGPGTFSMYQRSTAALIVALLCALIVCLAVSLETVTRGTIMAVMIPRIVTMASSSMTDKPRHRR